MPRNNEVGVRTVLLATDLSAGALHAARRVSLLPFAGDAQVLVVCVTPRGKREVRVEARKIRDAAATLAADVERTARDRGHAVTSSVEVITGDPFVEIIRASRAHEVDLVVLGRRSMSPGWQLGSTAARVVRHGSRPVLVVDHEPAGPYLRAVVALDLSDVSPTIVQLAKRVLDPGARARLVHAYHIPFEGFMRTSMPRSAVAEYERERRAEAVKSLAVLLRRFAPPKPKWKAVVSSRDPRVAIAAEIAALHADLVVLGTHGRTGVSRFLIGGVAESVLREAPCDVLIARPERFTYEAP